MDMTRTVLWIGWAVLQAVASVAVALGKDGAAALSRPARLAVATGFALSTGLAAITALTFAPTAVVAAAVVGTACPLAVGLLGDSFRPAHHVVRAALLGGLVALTWGAS